MQTGLTIEVGWSDNDAIKLYFSCSNGLFSGHASIYLSHDGLIKMAEILCGFPSHADDSRDLELGTFDPKYSGGGIQMHFHCLDSVGHVAADVKLRGDACRALGEVESVALRIPLEAAAIDSFVAQVKQLEIVNGARAHLRMAN